MEDASKIFYTVKEFVEKYKAEYHWVGYDKIYRLKKNSHKNGFYKVFIKYDRKILINDREFWKVVRLKEEDILEKQNALKEKTSL